MCLLCCRFFRCHNVESFIKFVRFNIQNQNNSLSFLTYIETERLDNMRNNYLEAVGTIYPNVYGKSSIRFASRHQFLLHAFFTGTHQGKLT